MKITITREAIGRGLGVLILSAIVLGLSYLCTAWVWWEMNPGGWSMAARATALGFAVFLLLARYLAGRVVIAPSSEE